MGAIAWLDCGKGGLEHNKGTSGVNTSVTSGQLLCAGLFSTDPVAHWLCCVVLAHCLLNNSDQVCCVLTYLYGATCSSRQEPTETSKQPIRTRYLGHVTGCQPIRDQYFLIRSVPASRTCTTY
eukprot:sb/3475850/